MSRLIDPIELKRSIAVSSMIHDDKTLEQIIDEQPTVTQWIPCSERLPKERQDVIVTVNDGGIYTDTDEWTDMGFSAYGYNVIAWMPLPEPYKEDNQ